MKTCPICGNESQDAARFCPQCGTAFSASVPSASTERAAAGSGILRSDALRLMYRRLNTERIWWMVGGIIAAAAIVWLVIASFVIGELGAGSTAHVGGGTPIGAGFFGLTVAVYCVFAYAPVCIINFVMMAKAKRYRDLVFSDTEAVVARCSGAGMIVLGALFNTIAMIFIIMNFTSARRNRALLLGYSNV